MNNNELNNLISKLLKLQSYLDTSDSFLSRAEARIKIVVEILKKEKITDEEKKYVVRELNDMCQVKYLGDVYIENFPEVNKGYAWLDFLYSIRELAEKLAIKTS